MRACGGDSLRAMENRPQSPIMPTDDEARALARGLVAGARFAALGVIGGDGMPLVSRVAIGTAPDGRPVTLVSALAHHTRALRADPRASVLVGEPGERGDPLTHPRLTLQARARFVEHEDPAYEALSRHWLRWNRKAKLYIGFTDFAFVVFEVERAFLNGGFGKAFVLTPDDLRG
jgi:hypothetical protein